MLANLKLMQESPEGAMQSYIALLKEKPDDYNALT